MLSRRQPLQLRLLQHRRRLSLRLSRRLLPSRARVREQPAGVSPQAPVRSWGDIAGCPPCMVPPGMRRHHAPALCHQYNLKEPQEPVSSHSHMSPWLPQARLFLTHHKILMVMRISSPISLPKGSAAASIVADVLQIHLVQGADRLNLLATSK